MQRYDEQPSQLGPRFAPGSSICEKPMAEARIPPHASIRERLHGRHGISRIRDRGGLHVERVVERFAVRRYTATTRAAAASLGQCSAFERLRLDPAP